MFLLPAAAQTQRLIILQTSDTHSRIEPVATTAADESAGMGGTVRRATFLKQSNSSILARCCCSIAATYRRVHHIIIYSVASWK